MRNVFSSRGLIFPSAFVFFWAARLDTLCTFGLSQFLTPILCKLCYSTKFTYSIHSYMRKNKTNRMEMNMITHTPLPLVLSIVSLLTITIGLGSLKSAHV